MENLLLQPLKFDLQHKESCLKCPNLQIHIYFLSRTCCEMHKCLGAKKQPKMAISQCSKNLLLGAPTDHCRGQAPHCLTTTKKGREGRERARECELGFHDLEKRTWWNMRIENFTTSGLQTRHVNLPKGWVGKDSTPYKKKRIWWNMRIGNSTTSGPHVPQKNTSFHSTFSSANKHFMFLAS